MARANAETERNRGLRNFETQMWHKDGYPVSVLVNARMATPPEGEEGPHDPASSAPKALPAT